MENGFPQPIFLLTLSLSITYDLIHIACKSYWQHNLFYKQQKLFFFIVE